MLNWNDLGKCSNPGCSDQGSCHTFYPENCEEYANPLPQKCVCGCHGNQHLRLAPSTASETNTSTPAEEKPSSPVPPPSGAPPVC